MTQPNRDRPRTKLQHLQETKSLRDQALENRPSEQQLKVLKLAEAAGIEPDEPQWLILQALGIVQDVVLEAPERIKDAIEVAIELLTDGTASQQKSVVGLNEPQMRKLRQQLKEALETIAENYSKKKAKDYAFQWLAVATVAMLVCMLGGGAIGFWISEARSAEARRYLDWNQGLIAECQKQDRKTCNTHVVPPEQW